MTEHDEQTALFDWLAWNANAMPELALAFAIPNGGDRHPAVAAKLKAEGVKAGVPDICIPSPRGRYHGMFLELKARGGRLSAAQTEWLDALRAQGYYAVVAHGFDEATAAIEWYLSLGRRAVEVTP